MSDIPTKITKLAWECSSAILDRYDGETINANDEDDKKAIAGICNRFMWKYCEGISKKLRDLEYRVSISETTLDNMALLEDDDAR